MDEKYLEMADKISEAGVTAGIASARTTQPNQIKPKDFDGTCTCGEEIPPERVALHFYNCVVCQGRKEDRRFNSRQR